MAILNKEDIKKIIPHRYEMLLIDEIIEKSENSITGALSVDENSWFFKGHFPQEPVMPGVLMVEASAQTCAVLLLEREVNKGKIGYFGGVDKVKFRNKVIPGDKLIMKVTITRERGKIIIANVKGENQNGKPIFSGDLTLVVG